MDFLDNRELSWLKFNKRVIEEAVDEKVPLLERLTFSSIYQSNMDEFFMVRVGSITDEGLVDKDKRENKTNMTSAQQLDAIFTAVRRLQPIAEDAYIKTMSELKPFGFEHVSFDTATEEEKKFLELYFKREIKPLIAPIIIDKQHPFPFLKNKELYVTVQLFSKKNVKVGIIPVKHEHFERLIPLDNTGKRFIPAEEVILQFADLVFKNFKVIDKTIMRVTRNADLDFSHASEDFREFMTEAIKKRKKLAPVRLELSGEFSRAALDYICKKLDLKNERVFYSRIPLDLSYLFSLHELSSESCLKYNKREPQKPSCIADNRSIFSQVKSKDILLSGKSNFTDIRQFNLMFKTFQGVTEDTKSELYLRPETAQGIFVNFANIQRTSRKKVPFGVAQIGKSFRNEITPGNFIFRVREFEQMELEFFCKPGTDLEWFDYWRSFCKNWLLSLGINEENLRLRDHSPEELCFYSKATTDFEYMFPFGWGELWGIADRTDYDLNQHIKTSGKSLEYFDPETNEKYVPYVIEPSLGVERLFLSIVTEAYDEEELVSVDKNGNEKKEIRTVMRFHPALAPFKAAVLPLVKKLTPKAMEVYEMLSKKFNVDFDETGTIGKRYRRQDEIGTPFCITYDFDTLEKDNCVTIRDRDTMEQERVSIDNLVAYLEEKIDF